MARLLENITFDYSNYFPNTTLFIDNFYDNEILYLIADKYNKKLKNKIEINAQNFFINESILNSKITLKENNIKSGDIIKVIELPKNDKMDNNKAQSYFCYSLRAINFEEKSSKKKKRSIKNFKKEKTYNFNDISYKKINWPLKKSKCNFKSKKFYIPFIILIIFLLLLFIIIYFSLLKIKKEKTKINYIDEKLISSLDYKVNQIYNLLSIKETNSIIELEGTEEIPYKNRTFNITEYVHYIFGIEKELFEIDKNTNIKKKYYHGFLAINNITIENNTDIIYNLYFNDENEGKNLGSLNISEKLRHLNKKEISFIINNKSDIQPIISFDFYKNGEIKQIYIPNNLLPELLRYLNNLLDNFIPNLDGNSYCKNIKEELDKINRLDEILNEKLNNNETDINEERRRLEIKNKNIIKYKIIAKERNNFDQNSFRNLDIDFNKSAYTLDTNIKEIEFIDTDESKTNEINLREYSTDMLNTTNNNSSNNLSNITQYKQGIVDIEGHKLKNSKKAVSSYMEINEDLGLIKYINILSDIELKGSEDNDNQGEDNLDMNIVNNVYTPVNEEKNDDTTKGNTHQEEMQYKSMNIITNESIFNKNNSIIINENIILKLKKYFNLYSYELFNETSYGNKTMRILERMNRYINDENCIDKKIIIEKVSVDDYKREKKLRQLANYDFDYYKDTYYGLNDIDKTAKVFDKNVLGLKVTGDIENKITQNNGKTVSYYHSYFGNTKISYSVSDIQTNMHIITKNINEMAKKFYEILNNLEKDLIERGENYNIIILNLENKISDIISKNNLYDFSDKFKSPLNLMYNEVKNFTSYLFLDLISLIDQAYDNYTLLLKEIKAKKSISFEKIKEIIKNEYIEHINLSIYHLRVFSNFTLNYLDEISSLINTTNNIQIDILYDIIDNIEDCKNILKNFCKLLFNSIENGIKLFKFDLEDHIESVIGDLLYITEFISNGLENDEILKNSLEEKIKNDTIFKLKNFKNIINIIINQLVEEILIDYKEQMLSSNNIGIKFKTEKESSEFLSKIKNNSENLIDSIKIKIKYIEIYEEYNLNIEKINKINYIMINNLYDKKNDSINYIFDLKPEFMDEFSDIISNKKKLFEVSKKII